MYDKSDAMHDIEQIYPPLESEKGTKLLLDVLYEIGIENALTEQAIILLGIKNRETQS